MHVRVNTAKLQAKKAKHAAIFKQTWKTGGHTEGLGMLCDFCQEFDKRPCDRDTWNKTPCQRLRLESIRDHERCQGHLDAVNIVLYLLMYKSICLLVVNNLYLVNKPYILLYYFYSFIYNCYSVLIYGGP